MPGIGGISIATNLLANAVALNLNRNQGALQTAVSRLSSGLRVNTAADDPSGLAIATRLQSQSQAFDQGSLNVQDANNAATVAEGALQTETDILQRIRDLAVEASSDFTSNTDKLSLQAEVQQLLLEINRISQNTNFNGAYLLDGSHEGFTPTIAYNAIVNSNSVLGASSGIPGKQNLLIARGSPSPPRTIRPVDGTIQLQVAQLSASQQGIIFSFLSTKTNGYQQVCVATDFKHRRSDQLHLRRRGHHQRRLDQYRRRRRHLLREDYAVRQRRLESHGAGLHDPVGRESGRGHPGRFRGHEHANVAYLERQPGGFHRQRLRHGGGGRRHRSDRLRAQPSALDPGAARRDRRPLE